MQESYIIYVFPLKRQSLLISDLFISPSTTYDCYRFVAAQAVYLLLYLLFMMIEINLMRLVTINSPIHLECYIYLFYHLFEPVNL